MPFSMGFPNFKGKHAEDSMFGPKDFLAYLERIGKFPKGKPPTGVIICYSADLLDYVLKNYKTKKIEGLCENMYSLKETDGKVAIIGKFGIGAPVAAAVLEELIAFGAKKFIAVGMAGSLQKHIKAGDIVVCDKAIRDEGTSHHYIKHSKYAYASKEMTEKIKRSLEKFKQSYFVGTSWTIDACYRETVAEAKQYQREGVATVEMEAAALFAVAKYRNVDVGVVFAISDSLAELEWQPSFHSKKTEKSLKICFKAALDALRDE
jgi:uridine phosphorylase